MTLCSKKCRKLCGQCKNCLGRSFYSSPFRHLSRRSDEELKKISKWNKNIKDTFYCDECDHPRESTYDNISQGKGCSYCCKPPKDLCGKKECKSCFEKSFASSPFRYLSHRTDEELLLIFRNRGKLKDTFYCDQCPHPRESTYDSISSGYGCPYCSNQKRCCQRECETCFNHSFCSSKYRHLSIENDETLLKIAISSHKKGNFKCVKNHTWRASYANVNRGQGCPRCLYKTQEMVFQFLENNYDCKVVQEKKFDWCKGKKFDITIQQYIVEVDGLQHFEKIKHFNKKLSLTQIQQNDIYKMKKALENGYRIIRLHQEDVLFNRIPWKKMLRDALHRNKPKVQCFSKKVKDYDWIKDVFTSK